MIPRLSGISIPVLPCGSDNVRIEFNGGKRTIPESYPKTEAHKWEQVRGLITAPGTTAPRSTSNQSLLLLTNS